MRWSGVISHQNAEIPKQLAAIVVDYILCFASCQAMWPP